MWANVMQYLDVDGVTLGELHENARTSQDSLTGLIRWGYLRVSDGRGDDRVVRPTRHGLRAAAIWSPLAAEIETRWTSRLGPAAVARLRELLIREGDRVELAVPAYVPIINLGNNVKIKVPTGAPGVVPADADLSVLLVRMLIALTVHFERRSRLSLPICANTLRVLDEDGVRVRDLPVLSGVSTEAQAMAVGFLTRGEVVAIEPDPAASRGKVVRLTDKGLRAQRNYRHNLAATCAAWSATDAGKLQGALFAIVGDGRPGSPVFEGLTPYDDCWRASVRPLSVLPHYPAVLHRGGFPDGS
jgi:hypothetical protein